MCSKQDYDSDSEILHEIIEWIKVGWNNPKSIKIPFRPYVHKISKRIRSSLPCKKQGSFFLRLPLTARGYQHTAD